MLYSKKLFNFKNLIQGFTTREEGDFKEARKMSGDGQIISRIDAIAHIRDICDTEDLVLPEQVHGDKIAYVAKKDSGRVIEGVDGLITKEKGVILGVTTADCLPILFYEKEAKIAAVAHAGWKGSLKRISQKVVHRLQSLGGDVIEIIVVIGPHIKSCCYDIDEKRALMFKKKFGGEVIIRRNNKFFLDLTKVNLNQLLERGVKEKTLRFPPFVLVATRNRSFLTEKMEKNVARCYRL